MKPAGISVFSLLPLSMIIGHAAAFENSTVCYVLDSILFIYGLVLTVLYCRMKIKNVLAKKSTPKKDAEERVYEGLSHQTQDTYESLHLKHKP